MLELAMGHERRCNDGTEAGMTNMEQKYCDQPWSQVEAACVTSSFPSTLSHRIEHGPDSQIQLNAGFGGAHVNPRPCQSAPKTHCGSSSCARPARDLHGREIG